MMVVDKLQSCSTVLSPSFSPKPLIEREVRRIKIIGFRDGSFPRSMRSIWEGPVHYFIAFEPSSTCYSFGKITF